MQDTVSQKSDEKLIETTQAVPIKVFPKIEVTEIHTNFSEKLKINFNEKLKINFNEKMKLNF